MEANRNDLWSGRSDRLPWRVGQIETTSLNDDTFLCDSASWPSGVASGPGPFCFSRSVPIHRRPRASRWS